MSVQPRHCLALCAVTLVLGSAVSCGDRGGAAGSVQQTGGPGQPAQPGHVDPKLVAAVQKSTLIFDGTLIQPDEMATRADGMSVRVQQTFRQPGALDSLTRQRVIVAPLSHETLRPGDRAVFFAYGLSAGATLVVREVYRVQARSDSDVDAVRPLIAAADSVLTDSTILRTSQQSDAVVLIRVDSVAPVEVPDSIAMLGSEHAPEWVSAVLRVMSSFRPTDSALVNQRITVLFAVDESPLTDSPPQLHLNETWILWLSRLSRLPLGLRPGIDTTARYFLRGPQDVRPATDAARVARVLRP